MSKRKAGPSAPVPPRAPEKREPRRFLIFLVVAAAFIRLVYFNQLPEPFVEAHRGAQSDMHYYRTWSQQIAGGDWLSERLAIPEANWHVEILSKHVDATPDALARLQLGQRPEGVTPVAYAWGRWLGVPRFYQDALYPYLLAGTALVAGDDVRWAFAWQMVLGIASTVLIWAVTRRSFGERAGRIAAIVALLTAPLMYYELVLLRESTIVFVSLLIAWLVTTATVSARPVLFGVTGVVVGVAALLKSSLLLFVLAVVLSAAVVYRANRSLQLRAIGAFMLGVSAGLTPLVARNISVGVPPFALASSGPLTFVAANEVTNRPKDGNFINTDVLARFLGRSDGGWGAAFSHAFDGHTLRSYSVLMADKLYRTWHWYELPNNENFYLQRLRVPVLRWLPITAWLIAPLALVGLVLGLRRFKDAWPLYQLIAVAIIPLLLFYVVGRFRIVLIAAAIPFAALTLGELWEAVRRGQLRRVGSVALGVLVVGLWTGQPLDSDLRLIRTDDWLLPYTTVYQPQMRDAGERGDFQGAARACEASFAESPSDEELAEVGADPQLPLLLADIRLRCAALWSRAGDDEKAAQQAAAADALARRTPR